MRASRSGRVRARRRRVPGLELRSLPGFLSKSVLLTLIDSLFLSPPRLTNSWSVGSAWRRGPPAKKTAFRVVRTTDDARFPVIQGLLLVRNSKVLDLSRNRPARKAVVAFLGGWQWLGEGKAAEGATGLVARLGHPPSLTGCRDQPSRQAFLLDRPCPAGQAVRGDRRVGRGACRDRSRAWVG